jgi:putative PIN family toxin of toxin-antitoxin system
VVIDTNLVLSALVFSQGQLTPLRRAWEEGRIQPIVSKDTAAELVRVLAYPKFKLMADEQQELLADYLPWCKVVTVPNPPPLTPICRDPFDIQFLQLAVAGKAHSLITGDRDLLCLADVFACPIVTAEQFMSALSGG